VLRHHAAALKLLSASWGARPKCAPALLAVKPPPADWLIVGEANFPGGARANPNPIGGGRMSSLGELIYTPVTTDKAARAAWRSASWRARQRDEHPRATRVGAISIPAEHRVSPARRARASGSGAMVASAISRACQAGPGVRCTRPVCSSPPTEKILLPDF
jgi:hypothetical protein